MRYISLGFSCQTRFTIDTYTAEFSRLPFDFNITTRAALLDTLHGRRSFAHMPDDVEIYRLSDGTREVIHANGIYLWHDYRMQGDKALSHHWRDQVATVNSKYEMLHRRLFTLLRDSAVPKTLVISNTQENLSLFTGGSDDEFHKRFGLDNAFRLQLDDALEAAGARNLRLCFLNRDISKAERLRRALPNKQAGFESRFGGLMELPTNRRFAASFLFPKQPDGKARAALELIAGEYERRHAITVVDSQAAYAYEDGKPIAEITVMPDGYMFVFSGKIDDVRTAVFKGDELRFSNREKWCRPAGSQIRRSPPQWRLVSWLGGKMSFSARPRKDRSKSNRRTRNGKGGA